MTDFRDAPNFEDDLRRTMGAVEAAARPSSDFQARLLAIADAPRVRPHRVRVRSSRLLPPLLAAAAVVAVVAGGAALVSSAQSQRLEQPAPPGPSRSAPTGPATTSAPVVPPAPSPRGSAVPKDFTTRWLSFDSPDPAVGWAIGDSACPTAAGLCPVLVRTVDGGAHWRSLPTPAGLDAVRAYGACEGTGEACVDHITFADERHGWLWSHQSLFATSDGGATWAEQPGGATALVVTAERVLRLRPSTGCTDASCRVTVQATPVGSGDWTDVGPAGPALLQDRTLLATAGPDSDHAYLLATVAGTGTDVHRLYRSDDSGRTWTVAQKLPCGDLSQTAGTSLSVAPAGELAVTCLDPVDSHYFVNVSTDGGVTFGPARRTPADRAASSVGAPPTEVIAASAENLVAWVGGGPGGPGETYYVSRDGGATWTQTAADDIPQPLVVADFLNPYLGFRLAPGGDGVFVTGDGGGTWTRHSFS